MASPFGSISKSTDNIPKGQLKSWTEIDKGQFTMYRFSLSFEIIDAE